ncbi:MAG: RluA family pseudouridine synthase, partial [Bacilli bacterium]|nr:RluA family pseudouridine synthase [Bacilli bacterium]
MEIIKIIDESLINLRLDKALSILKEQFSRSKIQEYIDNELILVNGKIEKSSYKIKLNDEIIINDIPQTEYDLIPENIPLDIIYEDDDVLVINKQKGLIVHPGAGVNSGTLANALKYHIDHLSSLNGTYRPGIVHRIDKDTTGLLIVAKNDYAHKFLSDQLVDHTLSRKYYALVLGKISEDNGKIIAPIGRDKNNRQKMCVDLINGKEAITNFKVIKRYKLYTLVECKLQTGRTHQIRVHFEYINHPVIGDEIYGKGNRKLINDGQLLHAFEISFIHP